MFIGRYKCPGSGGINHALASVAVKSKKMCCFWWSAGVKYTSASVAKGFNHALVSVAVNYAPAFIEEKNAPASFVSRGTRCPLL